MSNTPLRLETVSSTPLYNGFQRVVMRGEGLQRIPEKCAGLHIKLFFKTEDQQELILPWRTDKAIQWPEPKQRPISRTFSIRSYDRVNNLLTVDFVLHPEPGVASEWAIKAKPGDFIGMAGPGTVTLYNDAASDHLLIGDLSSLPALVAVAEELPNDTPAVACIELPENTTEDPQWFKDTEVNVNYFTQRPAGAGELLQAIRSGQLCNENTGITLAGEHHTVVALRQYFRDLNISKEQLYAVPYWRYGDNEEAYHADRHGVMDN